MNLYMIKKGKKMTNFSLTEIIFSAGNLIVLATNILLNYYQFKSNQKEKISSEIANNVINQLFIPFQNSLGIKLYKKITQQNWEELQASLLHFKEILDYSKESYYLSDTFHLSMGKLFPYLKLDILSKKDFKRLNKEFKKFSKGYLREHSHFRKTLHLPIKGVLHRIQFKLYSNIWDYLHLISKLSIVIIVAFCIFIIFISIYFTFSFRFLNWFYEFLSP